MNKQFVNSRGEYSEGMLPTSAIFLKSDKIMNRPPSWFSNKY